jgi:hypothetical protein
VRRGVSSAHTTAEVAVSGGGGAVRGVDDLGLVVQPSPSGLGVAIDVSKAERGRADHGVVLDARSEGVRIGMQDEVTHGDRVAGEA